MTIPSPSLVRTVSLDTVDQVLSNRGGIAPSYLLPGQNPLDRLWSWINATGWCNDIGDVIGQVGWQIIGGDGALSVLQSTVARAEPYSSMFAGVRVTGGTVGSNYLIRIRITGLNTGEQRAVDVEIPIIAGGAVQPLASTQATVNGDALVVGGIPLFVS
jgi:hypothetical protein